MTTKKASEYYNKVYDFLHPFFFPIDLAARTLVMLVVLIFLSEHGIESHIISSIFVLWVFLPVFKYIKEFLEE